MSGTYWPPKERYSHIIEEIEREYQEHLIDEEAGKEQLLVEKSLGIAPTEAEAAVMERAARLAKEELRQQAQSLLQHTQQLESERVNVADDDADTEDQDAMKCTPDSSQASAKSHGTPQSKRQRPMPLSPSQRDLPRQPEVAAEIQSEDVVEPIDLEASEDALLLATQPPAQPTQFAQYVDDNHAKIQDCKAAIFQAQLEGGNEAAVRVKMEKIEQYSQGQISAEQVMAREMSAQQPQQPPAAPHAPVASSSSPAPEQSPSAAANPQKKPPLNVKEMQMLYLKVREQKFQWTPDEDDHYQVAEVDSGLVVKLDAVVPKGTGKSCGSSLGAKYSCAHIRWCFINSEGEEEYANFDGSELDFDLMAPDLVHNSKAGNWMSFVTPSHDFVPSKHEMAVTMYGECKNVKFDAPRNRGAYGWSVVDTVSSTDKLIPIRLYDCDKYIDLKKDIEGPFPQEFKDYCAEKDLELIKLMNDSMLKLSTFITMREHYPTMYLPRPIQKFHEWADNSQDFLMAAIGNMAARDIVKEEEDAVTRNNKKDDKTVPKQMYDQVVKNLPARRTMCERLGRSVFKNDDFNLPMTPLSITIRDPPAHAAQKRKQDQTKKAQGRQHGPMAKKQPAPTSRTSRQVTAQQEKEKREKEQKEKEKEREKQERIKKNAATAKNSASNAAAGSVAGGQPMPPNAHTVPSHLRAENLQQLNQQNGQYASSGSHGSPISSLPSGLSSMHSAAITEMQSDLKEMKSEIKAHQDAFKDLLKGQTEEHQKHLLDLSQKLAASQATVHELREANASSKSMQKTLENMCNSMLKTMETMQVAGAK